MLKPKFEIGQKVFVATSTYDSEIVHAECDVCNSTGKVKISGRDEEYICPICHGRTEEKHYGFKYIIAYRNAIIGKVQTEEYSKRYRSYQSRITYMLQETGVVVALFGEKKNYLLPKKKRLISATNMFHLIIMIQKQFLENKG